MLVLLGNLVLTVWAAVPAVPAEAVPPAPSRGELLYTTHCLACHSTQVHWRERKLARDWPTLRREVNRWQRAAQLGWSADDVAAVARYLNETIYAFPAPLVSAHGAP